MAKLSCVIFDWAGTTVDFDSMSPVAACRRAEITFYQHGADFVIRNLGLIELLQQVFESRA